MKNKIEDVRNHLFAILEGLADPDPEKPIPLDRAKAAVEVAQAIINTAKVEVDYLKATGQRSGTRFFPEPQPSQIALPRKPS